MAPSSDLSRALTSGNCKLAKKLARQFQFQASQWTKRDVFFDGTTPSRVLPLHEAIVAKATFRCIQVILEIYSNAIWKTESSFQRLPLHCACWAGSSPQIIQFLIEQYEDACVTPDSLGRLPLHYALTTAANGGGNADFTTVQTLLKANPRAARGQDKEGITPLYVACCAGASVEIIELLLKAYPEAVWTLHNNNKGTTSSQHNCLIPRKCPQGDDVKQLIRETKERISTAMRLPSLRRNSVGPSCMIMA
eukprot:CAMPEP_0198147040 /NCGR_PEP_ID=MMETSP1443-20131203/33062_1 /TAXON_ID=186043 /ORGANISM="Entomoneis sp., Strain CCMP2396" /LENGTH=249 /DNA_ID=CAMNT_0043811193 /DNA_START=23 /DNA_END=772 /DNA_ORIENTATION=+